MRQANVRVFEPNELASKEKERLLGALEVFVNMGDGLKDFTDFGQQNPAFFPFPILDDATTSLIPLASPCAKGSANMLESLHLALSGKLEEAKRIAGTPQDSAHGEEKIWTKVIAWEPCCQGLALFYRDMLRLAWKRQKSGPHGAEACEEFLMLLAIDPPERFADWQDAFSAVRAVYPAASATAPGFSRLWADWRTGTFDYLPDNDFQKAVYILFREGWRAKTCVRCARRFIAGKPAQAYCSTECFQKTKRERGGAWWKAHGKKWRIQRAAKGAGSRNKRSQRKRTVKGAK